MMNMLPPAPANIVKISEDIVQAARRTSNSGHLPVPVVLNAPDYVVLSSFQVIHNPLFPGLRPVSLGPAVPVLVLGRVLIKLAEASLKAVNIGGGLAFLPYIQC